MNAPALTAEEARVLYTALHNMWVPMYGPTEFKSAVHKLAAIGGGLCCRGKSACILSGKLRKSVYS